MGSKTPIFNTGSGKDEYVSRRLVDQIVHDFLNTQGFQQAATALEEESNLISKSTLRPRHSGVTQTDSRQELCNLILNGNLLESQKMISKIEPTFFDKNNELLFDIRLQQLVESIRKNEIESALDIAASDIGPLVSNDKLRLESIQNILSLLVEDKSDNKIMNEVNRLDLWNRVNQSMLANKVTTSEPGSTQSALESIFHIGCWSERQITDYDSTYTPKTFEDFLQNEMKSPDEQKIVANNALQLGSKNATSLIKSDKNK